MILTTKDLVKKYDKDIAVNHVNISFKKGVNALLGANGAGKTTLINMLVTNSMPSSGKILLDNKDILKCSSYKSMLGYLPQDFYGYADFTAKEFMYYMAALKKITPHNVDDRIMELLDLVSLVDVCNKEIRTFSGGMRRRIGIAQALINNPKILLLDEPTTGLDPKERIKFSNIIKQLSSDSIIILSTHIIPDVEHIAENFIIMDNGKVLMNGTKQQILAQINGKVWECVFTPNDKNMINDLNTLLNYRTDENGNTIVKVISEQRPYKEAYQIKPCLEDVFLKQL